MNGNPYGIPIGIPIGIPLEIPLGIPLGIPTGITIGIPIGNSYSSPMRFSLKRMDDGAPKAQVFANGSADPEKRTNNAG